MTTEGTQRRTASTEDPNHVAKATPRRTQSADTEAPVRVRVTSPRTSAARARRVSIASEIDAQSRLGEVYINSLMRSQLRLALVVCGVLGATLGLVPLVFHLVPAVGRLDLLGVPIPWLVLTVVAFVEIVALGVYYVRRAERNEDAFSDLLEGR